MSTLTRPDGAGIHWDQRGDDGPPVYVLPNTMISMPSNFEGLIADLARDHRVVTWDPRGTGASSRTGPYDLATDTEDLAALVAESGGPAIMVSPGGNPVALAVAETHPELVASVVLLGWIPRLSPGGDPDVVTDSDAVMAATLQMLKTDPRALLRTWVQLGNPQLSEAELRARVDLQGAYCPPEAGVPRVAPYLAYDPAPVCAALGDRLWLLRWDNVLSTPGATPRARKLLPEAHIVEADDGPISRPDVSAAFVREAAAAVRPA